MAQLISIIIPVYNHAQELLACLDSIESQTYRNVEVIIVDDASLEPVANVLTGKTYSFSYELIRLAQNQDAPRARNEGFKRSKGELLLFLDADVVLRPHALEVMATTLQKHPSAAFVYSSFYFGWKLFRNQAFDRDALQRQNYIHTSSLLRRGSFSEFDPDLRKFQDWDLWLTIAERGGVGVWIDEPLFTVVPRRLGKSHWLPRIAYHVPWPLFGYTPSRIKRYREAEKRIREKHPIAQLAPAESFLSLPIWLWTVVILFLECLSALAIFSPHLNGVFAILVALLVGVVAIFRPLWALTFLSVEYVIGSKGGLLKYGADATNNGGINLRILIFVAFMVGWTVNVLRTRSWNAWRSFLQGRWIYGMLALVLAAAFLQGVLRGQRAFLLADANAWGMWILLLPVLDILSTKARAWRHVILPGMIAASFWMLIKTLLLFYFFSHGFFDSVGPVYYWVRRSGVGEMTKVLPDAAIYRIFFQSHIYAACIALGAFVGSLYGVIRQRWIIALRILALAAVFISLSRSLWIGLAAGYVFAVTYVFMRWFLKKDGTTIFWKRALVTEVCLGTGACMLIAAIAYFPLPITQPSSLFQVIESRTDVQEDAAKSRWELLPVLKAKILERPIMGFGFGSTVTYQTHDPRLVAAQQKTYTTFAVEWGWHEFWVKFGIIGIPLMIALLYLLYRRVAQSSLPIWVTATTAAIFVLLAATHVFTPYLNHPLGFFLLLMAEGALALPVLDRRATDSSSDRSLSPGGPSS